MTPNTNSTWNNQFKKSPLSYRSCDFLGCTAWAFNRFDPTTQKNWGHSSPRWDQKLHILRKVHITFWLLLSCNQTWNEDLKKLFQSHPKDFGLRKILADIFIIQCNFTGKLEARPHFQALQLVLAHWQNRTMCQKKVETSCWAKRNSIQDSPFKSV